MYDEFKILSQAGRDGVAFTPWVTLPGVYTPDVLRPLLDENLLRPMS
ncbi:hypothetical protein AVEN_270644-1, partial [Araneus ventricosus]